MSTQIFLHFELQGRAIHGEASTIGYEGEIELESFNFDLGEESPAAKKKAEEAHQQAVYEAKKANKPEPKRKEGSGKGAGNTLTLTKFYDKSSTNFARYLASGVRFDEARISIDHHVAAGSKQANPAMTIHLFNGQIKGVELDLSDNDKSAKLTETIKLSYRKIEIAYYKAGATDRSQRTFGSVFTHELPNFEA